jgi:hypothetical protein
VKFQRNIKQTYDCPGFPLSYVSCNSIKTFDFSILYTTIPHSKLKDTLRELVQLCFIIKNGQRRYKYLVLGRDRFYLVKHHFDSTKKFHHLWSSYWHSSSEVRCWLPIEYMLIMWKEVSWSILQTLYYRLLEWRVVLFRNPVSYCASSYSRGGVNHMWILKNSKVLIHTIYVPLLLQ